MLLGYILLLPPQLNVSIGGSVLPPYRFFLLPAALYVIVSGIRGSFRFTWPDVLIGVAAAWISLALFMTSETMDALTASAAQVSDIALAYFFARVAFRSLDDLRLFLLLMAPGLAAAGAILAVESVTRTHILQPLFGVITGQAVPTRLDIRLGFMRAPGPFPHPILAGVFLASFLPLYWLTGVRGWPKILGLAASVAAFFTVSSASLIALAGGVGLIVYNWLSERISNLTWRLFFIVSSIGFFAAELGTNSGAFSLVLRFASLNSISAFNRVLIWKYGSESVRNHPWFGIGYADWERPVWMVSSVDHFWLLTAMRFGILPPVLIALALLLALIALARRSMHSDLVDQRAERGVAIALGIFSLAAVSVALWLSIQVWYFMLLGAAVSIGYSAMRLPAQSVRYSS